MLIHFLCMTVPLFFLFTTDELFEFNKMMLTYSITILIALSYVGYVVLQKPISFPKTPLDIPIALFFISQLLATVFSIHPFTSLFGYYSRFHGGLLSTATYIVLYYAVVGTVRPKEIKKLVYTLLISGILVSIYAALEHFGHSFSCLLISKGSSFGVDCWVQDVQSRVFATFGQPNWLAAFLIALIPISLSGIGATRSQYLRIASALTTFLFVVVLIYTQSRSGIIGFIISMTLSAPILTWWFIRKQVSVHQSVLLGIVGVGAVFFLLWYPTPVSEFITSKVLPKTAQVQPLTDSQAPTSAPVNRLEIGGTDSGDIRKIVWTGAYNVWKRYPLFGSGVETFAYSYYQDRPAEHNLVSEWDFLYNKAHNEFLNFLATTGIAGFAAYCFFLGSCIVLYIRLVNQKNDDAQSIMHWYGLAFLSATTAVTISNFFGFSTVVVGILLFLFPALAVIALRGKTAQTQKLIDLPQRNHSITLGIFTSLALIAIFSLAIIYRYWSADIDFTAGKSALREGQLREGFAKLEQAISKNPQEALFVDTLASEYASYAVQFAQAGQATTAAQLATESVGYIRKTLELNSRQLNYYKTSARSLILLSQFDDQYLQAAQEVLTSARGLAPTDPKIIYNLGLVEIGLGNQEEGISLLEETVKLKPNYDTVRAQLAQEYEKRGEYQQALEQLKYIVEYINPNAADVQQKIASLSAKIQKKQ